MIQKGRQECIFISREGDGMSDMLAGFVKKELNNQIKTDYPHIQYPSGMYAKVVQVTEKDAIFTCTLKMLDKAMNADESFPEIPQVKTKLEVTIGDIVIVLLLYGGSGVHVIGRCLP